MTPADYARLKALFERALALPAEARDRFARDACPGEAALEAELRAWLAAATRAEGQAFLEAPPALDDVDRPGPAPGSRLGAYQVVGELGRGGMGVVLRAVRADDAYRKEVAVKLVPAAGVSARARERFLEERQILAGLDHPSIARLLDGGTTADGVPYLVMELVEGERIDAWCARRGASVEERLRLFLEVAAAVHHAHRQLVVHRDIKPANVLVTVEGATKLLDFGIARLVDDTEASLTASRVLTPAYASPEQLLGGPIGTASDVYSLGVLLHELLTGERPRRPGGDEAALAATMTGQEPDRPSTVAQAPALRRRLRGDLDVILLTALRTDPAARYGSAEAFADDVRRHLAGRPVRARAPTVGYRLSKFVRRNAGLTAAIVTAVAVLVVGAVATTWQARRADLARAAAERRFGEARKIARAMVFDVHDAIATLPGSTAARKLVVARGLEYLDGVAPEAGGDRGLCVELAQAYVRVGDVQGGAFNASLGDGEGALDSYGHAVALAASCGPGAKGALGQALRARSAVLAMRGRQAEGLADARQALALAEEDPGATLALAQAECAVGFAAYHAGDLAASREALEAAVRRLEAGVADAPPDVVPGVLAGARWQLAGTLWAQRDLAGATAEYEKARALQEAGAAKDPRNVRIRRQLAFTLESLGVLRIELGHDAVEILERAAALRRRLAADDPSDADAERNALAAESRLAMGLLKAGRAEDALRAIEVVLARIPALGARWPGNRNVGVTLAEARGVESMVWRHFAGARSGDGRARALARRREALLQARAAWRALEAKGPLAPHERATLGEIAQAIAALESGPANIR